MRDVRILEYLANGLLLTDIAKREKLSKVQISKTVTRLRKEFNAKTHAQLVAKAIRERVID